MLMGDTVFSEYAKITVPDDIQEKVYLDMAGENVDVSGNHWLLCIEPIVFGVWVTSGQYKPGRAIHMYIGDIEADLTLELVGHIEETDGTLLLLKLKDSHIYQLNIIKTWLLYYRYYRRGGLSFHRFKSFVAAYSYPRRIRLVSFRQQDYFNIFPMDLLGDIFTQRRYVFGLRHTNTSLPRIIESGKLTVCEIAHTHQEIIYRLGKHHSGNPPALDELPFQVRLSSNYGFYVPEIAESYKEVRILRTMNLGSHMLLWGETVDEQMLGKPGDHLYLVHFLHFLYQKDRAPYQMGRI
jgi:hypothetical protein